MPSVLALFAHPDDIEFVAAGTMLLLKENGWDLHYMNLCNGNCGSSETDPTETARIRLEEARAAARLLGATFYPPISNDIELTYDIELLRKVVAVVRTAEPDIVLTHSPSDYMEDHMYASRLAVTASFSRGMPNFEATPPTPVFDHDVTIYHAMPHGLRDPLRKNIRAGAYINTTTVHQIKRQALAAHVSQKAWLDVSQGFDSYLQSMDDMSREVGKRSGVFEFAEGWRRHLHLGLSASEIDPLKDALGTDYIVDQTYEDSLSTN